MTRTCTECGRAFPATKEFFYIEHNRLKSKCIECVRTQRREYQRIRNRKKVPIKTGTVEYLTPESIRIWTENLDAYKGRECDCLKENGKCVFMQCKWHLIDLFDKTVIRKASEDDMVKFLVNMPYTCMWEMMESRKSNGKKNAGFLFTQDEIASILGISKQRIFQIENDAFNKIRNRGKHLEDYMVDEVSNRYIKPEPVIGQERISDRKIIQVGHSKNFKFGATVQKQ